MDKEVKNTILQVGIVYGAFVLLVKPMLPTLGATPEEAAAIESVDQAQGVDNPFNYQYGPMINAFNRSLANGDTGGMGLCEYVKYWKNEWDSMDTIPAADGSHYTIDAITLAEAIREGFGWFKVHVTGNNTEVLSVFNAVKSKSDVASIAMVLWCLYSIDLWTYLKEGGLMMWRGLSSSDLKMIVDKVNSLPI